MHFDNLKLLDLLKAIAPGYQYELIDNINLGSFRINNASAFQVLETLRQNYGLHSSFKNKVLHVGFPASIVPGTTHEININGNVRAQENDLQYVRKEDVKMLIKAISIDSKTGKRIHFEFGDKNGSSSTLHFCDKTLNELEDLAKKQYKSLNYDGYQGSIPTWCIPRTRAGDALQITDPNYENSERDGKYLIESVEISFNDSDGIKRIVKPSAKL